MATKVTFGTNCWERDWKHVLSDARLKSLLERNPYPFAERLLLINNVRRPEVVRKRVEYAIAQGVFTKYVFVEDHAKEALDFFQISRQEIGLGYWYSIAEFVAIYLCQTEFLVYYKGDCIPLDATDWITPSIELMASDPRVRTCNPVWNEKYDDAKAESHEEKGKFYIGYSFSDQCFLVRTADFRAPIYRETHPASARYPLYAGESFEKRVDSQMRNHEWMRGTFKGSSYLHLNWPQTTLEKIDGLRRRIYRKLARTFALSAK